MTNLDRHLANEDAPKIQKLSFGTHNRLDSYCVYLHPDLKRAWCTDGQTNILTNQYLDFLADNHPYLALVRYAGVVLRESLVCPSARLRVALVASHGDAKLKQISKRYRKNR